MLSKLLLECSFSHAYVVFPGCVFICCHLSVVGNVSGEAVIDQGAVFFYAAVALFWCWDGCFSVVHVYIFIHSSVHVYIFM